MTLVSSFCHFSNGFLGTTRPVSFAVWSLLFTVESERDLLCPLKLYPLKLCPLKLLPREPPTSQAGDSHKLVFWMFCDLESARSFHIGVLSSLQCPLETYTRIFPAISQTESPTFVRVIMLCLIFIVAAVFSPLSPEYTTYKPYFRVCSNTVCSNKIFNTDGVFVSSQQKLAHLSTRVNLLQ